MHSYPVPDIKKKIRIIGSAPVLVFLFGFFDGAAPDKLRGAGIENQILTYLVSNILQ